MTDKQRIYRLINAERQYQDCQHGTLDENSHSIGEWLIILEAELNEAKHSWVKMGEKAALFEILQFAAVASACLEQHIKVGWSLVRGKERDWEYNEVNIRVGRGTKR